MSKRVNPDRLIAWVVMVEHADGAVEVVTIAIDRTRDRQAVREAAGLVLRMEPSRVYAWPASSMVAPEHRE